MAFTDILPDPTHKINLAGQADANGVGGPGYMGVKLSSESPMIKDKYNSMRYENQSGYHHKWTIDIAYNPLTCIEFHLIYGFLGLKRCLLKPFYVSVPPYESQSLIGITLSETGYKGDDTLLVNGTGVVPGMIFNLAGTTKIYKVTRVETNTLNDTAVASGKERLHITPPMVETVLYNTNVNFLDPLFKVVQVSDMSNYSLNKDGLFNFSLQLEEVY